MESVSLRVIFDHRIEKLTLPSGIPESLEELHSAVKQALNITDEISLQYMDSDFEDFFTLHSTNQIQHRSTIKAVTVAPIVLTLFPPNENFTGCGITEQTLDTTSSTRTTIQDSSDTSDSTASTVILSPNNSPERKPWPKEFIIPHFSVETEMVLERANEIYRKDGTVLTTPNVKSDILEKLAQSIYTYTAYPSSLQIISVAEALIKVHPCLKDRGSFSGLYAWQTSIKYKMANYRTKLRGFGIPEVTCNALKHKHPDDRKSAKNVKKPRRAEVNYLPSYPVGEDEKTLEKEREELVSEFKKKNNERMVKEKMNNTFAHRRHEIINQCPSVQNIKERWPALFQPSQVIAEFQRITTVQLEHKFMSSLDLHTPKLLTLFRGKGGALGERLKTEMELLKDEQCSVDMRREVVIRCIIEFLGEHAGDLIKEFKDNEDQTDQTRIEQLVMAVIVTKTGTSSESPKDIGIVVEGEKVVTGLEGVPRACCVLFGLIYALNLHYPRHLKYTFEVLQKLFLELDASKLSNRVQSLRSKLLS